MNVPFSVRPGAGERLAPWVFLGLALLFTLPFWLTDLDLAVMAWFRQPGAENEWPLEDHGFWQMLYHGAPLLTGLLLVGSLAAVALGGLRPRWRRWRLHGFFVFATVLLGPGLLVNGVFKEHWGHPRPHQVESLGGEEAYQPPLRYNAASDGKSFPCGHSSVGFALAAFWLLLRHRRPRLGRAVLGGTLLLGGVLGVGRMVAGDHFLSDVLWSALMSIGVAWVLYYHVLNVPRRERRAAPSRPRHQRPWLAGAAYAGVGAVVLGGALLAMPVDDRWEIARPAPAAVDRLSLEVDAGDVELVFTEGGSGLQLSGDLRGFGWPGSGVERGLAREGRVWRYRVEHAGVFTERETHLTLRLEPGAFERVTVATGEGDIELHHPQGMALPELELEAPAGEVRR